MQRLKWGGAALALVAVVAAAGGELTCSAPRAMVPSAMPTPSASDALDAELRGTLQQQIFIGNDNDWNIRPCDGKLHAQVGAYPRRLTGGDSQRG